MMYNKIIHTYLYHLYINYYQSIIKLNKKKLNNNLSSKNLCYNHII